MQLTANRSALSAALSRVKQAATRSTMPILDCFKIEAGDGRIVITASDADLELTEAVECNISGSGGWCVNADKLSGFVAASRASDTVELTYEEDVLHVKCGRAKANLPTQSVEQFPLIQFPQAETSFTTDATELCRIINGTLPSASNGADGRSYISCIYLQGLGKMLRAVTTDGNRMTVCRSLTECEFPGIPMPLKTAALVQRLARSVEQVLVDVSSDKMRLTIGDAVLVSKLMEGNFVEYDRVLPKFVDTPCVFGAEAMSDAIARVNAVSDSDGGKLKPRGMRLKLLSDRVIISSGILARPNLVDEIDAEYPGPEFELGLSSRYAADALDALGGKGEIELHCAGAEKPTRLCPKGNRDESVTLMFYRAG